MRPTLAFFAAVTVAAVAFAQPTPTPPAAQPTPEQAVEKRESEAQKALRYAVGWNAEKAKETLAEATNEAAAASADFKLASALAPMAEGKLDAALAAVSQLAKDAPTAPGPEYFRGELMLWKGDAKGADAAWKAAASKAQALLTKSAKDGWSSLYLGAARIRLRQYGPAKEALSAALGNGASEPLVRFQLGLLAAAEQRWQDSVDAFTAALAKDSGLAYAYYYRGLAWSKLKRTDQLLLDMDRFLALAPESPDAPKARSVLESSKR